MLNLPKPSTQPGLENDSYIVILGGTYPGCYQMNEDLFDLPGPGWDGPSLPIAVRCRSQAEAEKIFIVQRVVKEFGNGNDASKEDIKNALMSSKALHNLFEKDGKVESGLDFFAVLTSRLPFPCIFLTWADAYKQLNDGTPDGMVRRCKTFLDALLWMVLRPKSIPDMVSKIHFTRPILDDEPATSKADGKRPAKRLRAVSEDAHAEGSNSVKKQDEIFTHIRDLTGKVLRSVKISERPREVIRLPSLGEDADSLVDGIGLSPSAILTIHAVLIEVVRDVAYSNRAREFTDRLVGLGMALMEAKLIWNSINKQIFLVPRVTVYRDKLNLGVL